MGSGYSDSVGEMVNDYKRRVLQKVESAVLLIPDSVPGSGQITTSGISGNAFSLFATPSLWCGGYLNQYAVRPSEWPVSI